MGAGDGAVEVGGVLHEDGVGHLVVAGDLDVVADAALDRHIRDQTQHGLRIQARSVAGVRVAIGVAVLAIEEEEELVAVADRLRHRRSPGSRYGVSGAARGGGILPRAGAVEGDLLVVAEGEEALLFESQGAGHVVPDAAPGVGDPSFVPAGEAAVELVEMELGGAREAAQHQGGRGAGGGVVALDDAGADIAEGAVLQGGEHGHEPAAVVGGLGVVFVEIGVHEWISSRFPEKEGFEQSHAGMAAKGWSITTSMRKRARARARACRGMDLATDGGVPHPRLEGTRQLIEVAHQGGQDEEEAWRRSEAVAVPADDGELVEPRLDVSGKFRKISFHPIAHHDAAGGAGKGEGVIMVVLQIRPAPGIQSFEQFPGAAHGVGLGQPFVEKEGEGVLFRIDVLLNQGTTLVPASRRPCFWMRWLRAAR